MKSILFIALLFCTLHANALQFESGEPGENPAKKRALELRDSLFSICDGGDPGQEAWDGICAKIDGYTKEFGVTEATKNNVYILRKQQLWFAVKYPDQTKYLTLLKQLADDPIPIVSAMAKKHLAVLQKVDDLKTKPVELKFTALDGSLVDLEKWRGKVVLVDFWATWCPDCKTANPSIVETYKEFHDQGFEIVGIALDDSKEKVLQYTAENGMPWPQYFDGKKWDTDISRSFGIRSIPTLWLFDKNGMFVAKVKSQDLASQVKELLKKP